MRHTATPACRPTAGSIWSSFRSSGKKHLLLTGAIGSGKTTLLSQLFPVPQPGITTWAEANKGVFLRDNLSGTVAAIARYDATRPGTTGKMVLCSEAMSTAGVAALEGCLTADCDWVTIDEIGFLEENCEAFQKAVRKLLEHKRVAAVVRKQDLPFLNELRGREDVFLVDLDRPFGNAGCVIMASGLGKRFGENKLMVDFGGAPMIARALDASDGLFAKRVVITRHEAVASYCRKRNVSVVLHDRPHRSDTIRLGMKVMEKVACCAFLLGDQPLLSKETVASLLLCSVNSPEQIWRTYCEAAPGSPVVFPEWSFAALRTLPEGKGGSWIIKQHPEKTAFLHIENPWELMDADTPDALETLKRADTNKNI